MGTDLVWFGIITLFPEMFSLLQHGVTGRALKEDLIRIHCWNPRAFTEDKHKTVDDRPYGGGPGMVMMAEPLQKAIHAAKAAAPHPPTVVYLSPQGQRFDQKAAQSFLEKKNIILVAGRYEGIDERLITLEINEEWSIGDYILSGGELAALIMIDVIARLIPGVLGHEESASKDSLSADLLKYPQYTRPPEFQGLSVPPILMSGKHQLIERWRLQQSLGRTWLKRPDLFNKINLDPLQLTLLWEFIQNI